ncbi:MAG: hypothetical protein ACE5SW_05570 [Nitrososphaeraceae archaeon]
MPSGEKSNHKSMLKYFIFSIIISTIISNSIVLFSDSHIKHFVSLLVLNITAAIASILGIITIYRHGIYGVHGKSYLFLTLGIISWFFADFLVLYNYHSSHIKELELASTTDFLWFIGYGFLALHLFIIMRSLDIKINSKVFIGISIITSFFIGYNVVNLLNYDFVDNDFLATIVTLAYPILDFILIIPSSIILITLRKDFLHNFPWFLSSLSLLVNAIADDGYVNDFVAGNSENLWFWELFYIADFIIMSAALLWYNKFNISKTLARKTK